MSKRILLALVPMALVAGTVATLVSWNGSKTYNVKIKVGVVLKSGDVKSIARRDLIISKADIIDLWETSKKNCRWTRDLIKKDTQDEIGFDAKLNSFRESINEKSSPIRPLRANLQGQREILAERLYEHIEKTFDGAGPYSLGAYFVSFTNHSVGLDEKGLSAVEKTYDELINDDVKLTPEAKQFVAARYAEFKEIKDSYARYASALAAVDTSKAQRELDNLLKEQKEFIKYFNEKVAEKDKSYFEKAKSEFLLHFTEALVSILKTGLNGEVEARLPEGRCFLFCSAEVGLNHITWNYSANITEEGQYIELANDNAFSFKKEDTTQLLKVLYEALAKMEGIQAKATRMKT
jgi:hypothetical protein